ncbi:MarR family transcriptional regulator [Streptomyces sp. NPDC006971]|uniref:MarR family winged helix-turn-helix transcriptional regulator n=1 Tax=Streptomyces sp. NPDC006971 TaxID=3154784 RepID=UPI0033D3C289
MNEDDVDRIAAAWARERPDLDVTALAVVGRLLFVAENRLAPAGAKAVETHGINKADFDVLATLRRQGAPYSLIPSALSAELMMSRAGMTKRLDRLEAAGLIQRVLDPEDRRSFRVSLTAEGLDVADAALTDLVETLADLSAGLNQDQLRHLDEALRVLAGSHERGTGRTGE